MRALAFVNVFASLLLLTVLAGFHAEPYGRPGSPNGGIVITRSDTCKGAGVELWGHPGPFAQFDC